LNSLFMEKLLSLGLKGLNSILNTFRKKWIEKCFSIKVKNAVKFKEKKC